MPTFGSLIRAKHGGKPGGSRKVEALVRQPSRRKETKANREAFDDNEARSHFSCIAQACDGSSRRKLRLYAAAQSGFLKTGCARRRRRQSVLAVTMPNKGDEFHHFGWNACSSALSPLAGHAFVERRYLIIPGIRSSRIYVVDTKPDPTKARIHKIIEPEEVLKKTGYSRPHTVHCGPEGIYVSTLGGGGPDGTDGPPGIFVMDCETFDVLGRWEIDRGPQDKHYDFWWNLPRDYMVSSEWALPPQFEKGIVPEDLLGNKYGHRIHFWDLRARRNVQTIDLGANHQMALEVRPAHDPIREHGFVGVVVDTTNLEGSIWTWWRDGGKFHCEKTPVIPPEPAGKDQLPPLLQGFGAVPPLISDIDLSMDDRFLYVSCWGTGEMRQYDVRDPRKPKHVGSVHIGGIARRTPHPNGKAYAGGPQID